MERYPLPSFGCQAEYAARNDKIADERDKKITKFAQIDSTCLS